MLGLLCSLALVFFQVGVDLIERGLYHLAHALISSDEPVQIAAQSRIVGVADVIPVVLQFVVGSHFILSRLGLLGLAH